MITVFSPKSPDPPTYYRKGERIAITHSTREIREGMLAAVKGKDGQYRLAKVIGRRPDGTWILTSADPHGRTIVVKKAPDSPETGPPEFIIDDVEAEA